MPYTYEHLMELPFEEKAKLLERDGRIFHVIFARQFNRDNLNYLFEIATKMRIIGRTVEGIKFLGDLLPHKSAMLYFMQPSTRTYLSFVRACQYLGMDYAEVRDPRVSSAFKGESDIDGVRTFSSYFDIIIMRHSESGFAERVAYMMNETNRTIPVVSGGAGMDEHPTQALLDMYTMHRSFETRVGGLDGIHVAFVGDIRRGRTVHSLSQLLTLYNNVKMTFVAPEELRLADRIRAHLDAKRADYAESSDLNSVIEDVDAIYVTRIQDEYDVSGESKNIDYTRFHLTLDHVNRMKESAIVMHPLPRRAELDPNIDRNHRAMYWRQERNGMWMRAALVSFIFRMDQRILEYYSRHFV
ncbi:MAG: Aspartate carbamoyltransferase catalytic chain [candidate division BRC1 bacterium ADurb.BinA364]|nr:MAG: Aspartate carbamoyltransferase catalytic chain [candidate division BRC1 bacterium ADurb.BinA364]